MACLFPFGVRNKRPMSQETVWINVPCGKCPDCLKTRSNGWLVRLLEEDKIAKSSLFITLTYSEETVPKTETDLKTLRKSDVQKFIKRLRKMADPSNPKICYYAAGEYGDRFSRPHYHIIIFNAKDENISRAWSLSQTSIGDVQISPCSGATINYTLKYMHKANKIPSFSGDDRQPEFSLMSKRLGKSYATPQMVAYHQSDKNRFYATLPGGIKTPLSRYLKNLLYTEPQRHAYAKLIAKTSEFEEAKRFLDSGLTPDAYRRAKFEAKKASITNFKNKSKR